MDRDLKIDEDRDRDRDHSFRDRVNTLSNLICKKKEYLILIGDRKSLKSDW